MTGPLNGRRILVSGAGVAGPALAWWLGRHGAHVTVVEIAPAVRTSGFAVDFRGPTHERVLAEMGVLEPLRAVATHGGAMRVVDADGKEIFTLPADFAGGDLEVSRADLSRILVEHGAGGGYDVEYRFGEEIRALTETADGVHVEFARGPAETVDLVVGADGLHSRVRRLAFGPEDAYVRHLGYHLAGWTLPNTLGVDPVVRHYNEPGRLAAVGADPRDGDRAQALVVFASDPLPVGWHDVDAQKAALHRAFAGMGGHAPALLDGLDDAPELYFDAIARCAVPAWSTGRVVLIGDAAQGVTLGGMGVGTGVVAAYVLAGELAAAGGDHHVALPAYEARMRRALARWQKAASPGEFLAPSTATRLRLRNGLLRSRLVRRLLIAASTSLASDPELPHYEVRSAHVSTTECSSTQ